MELLAVRQARLVAFISAEELNPFGHTDAQALTEGLVERYGFLKYPKAMEDYYNEERTVSFEGGRFGNISILAITIYPNGILVDTRSSTDDCEKVLEDALTWAQSACGLVYSPEMIMRRTYISQLVFRSDTTLNMLNPKLAGFTERVTKAVAKDVEPTAPFETTAIRIYFDPVIAKLPLDSFRVERLENAPFSENKYYSMAPLRTQDHLALLEEFEAMLKG